MVTGTTIGASEGASTLRPSMALSTDIPGVIAPSPYGSAAPTMPTTSKWAPGAGLGVAGTQQRQQGDDAAFAAVVRAQDQERIFQRDGQQQGPEDQRGNAEDGGVTECAAMGSRLGGLRQGVEGAGADIAVDHPEGAHGHGKRQRIRMVAGSDSGRTSTHFSWNVSRDSRSG